LQAAGKKPDTRSHYLLVERVYVAAKEFTGRYRFEGVPTGRTPSRAEIPPTLSRRV
jgi:hypothetical protein